MSPRTAATGVAVIGSGNIGTDLVVKLLRSTGGLELVALAGIDPGSPGLARARGLGVATTHEGVEGLVAMPAFDDVGVVFDATSARAHVRNAEVLAPHGRQVVDLTPAALGPLVVPGVNLEHHLEAPEVNMVTCGGQATIPVVAAIARTAPVRYAEIVATISASSAGPGTRENIDEFTVTTARALEVVGGAARGKAIIVLNPAQPPVMMRDTVLALVDAGTDREAVRAAAHAAVAAVAQYVPGYRLKQEVQFDDVDAASVRTLVPGATDDAADGATGPLTRVSAYLEVEGAADHLPAYAGNLDIMTSAALRVGELLARQRRAVAA